MLQHKRVFIWFFFLLFLSSSRWGCSSPAQVLGNLRPCEYDSDCSLGKGRCVKSFCLAAFAEPPRQSHEPTLSEPVLDSSGSIERYSHEPQTEPVQVEPKTESTKREPQTEPVRAELQTEPTKREPQAEPVQAEPRAELVQTEPIADALPDASVQKETRPELDPCAKAGSSCVVSGALGVCKDGLYACSRGVLQCKSTNKKSKEICNDKGKKDEDCDGKANEQDSDCKPKPNLNQCGECNKPSDCGASVTGYAHLCLMYPDVWPEKKRCYTTCRTSAECLKGFECRVYKHRSANKICWPPLWTNVGKYQYARWFCRHYENIGDSCKRDWDCGAWSSYADSGGRKCKDKKCTVRCNKDAECPRSMKCKSHYCR